MCLGRILAVNRYMCTLPEGHFTWDLYINPITGRGGGQSNPPPTIFLNIAQKPLELLTYNFFNFPKYEFIICPVKNLAWSIFSERALHALFETHVRISPLHSSWTPSGLFSVALKRFELLTYKFVTFSIYGFYTFSQIFRTIDYC